MHRTPLRPLTCLLVTLGIVLFQGCDGGGPTGIDPSLLELVIVHGDAQMAEPGAILLAPLTVRVQRIDDGRAREGVEVLWELVWGSGASLAPVKTPSDANGVASTVLTLGQGLGSYRVRARVRGMEAPPVEFEARAILVPELALVPARTVEPGETIVLEGRNFSSQPELNVVTFSGIGGAVVSATPQALTVVVPPCLPSRTVDVRVRIGSLVTGSLPLHVQGTPQSLELAVGEDRVLDAGEGLCAFHLPSSPQGRYLVVPHSTGSVGAATYGVRVVGLTEDGLAPAPEARAVAGPLTGLDLRGGGPTSGQDRFRRRLRALENGALARAGGRVRRPPNAPTGVVGGDEGPHRAPAVGDRREFRVLNSRNEFDRITAVVRRISEHCLIYVDEGSPAGGYTDSDLAGLEHDFEAFTHPAVTAAFGEESDLDGNGKVIILLTPAVNRLTEDPSEGFVGGYFFGIDLLPGTTGSNGGEVFYAVVPDPEGVEGPALSRSKALTTVPAILAHEFEHMVHFNQRMLLGGADRQEALWLSEALAQMAEDLVGWEFRKLSQLQEAELYRGGNLDRAHDYLLAPSGVSLLASLPPGTLAERGAGWLFLKCLSEQAGRDGLLGTLVRSTLTGIANVTQATGRGWASLLADHFGALYLDDLFLDVRPELECRGIRLKDELKRGDPDYPLQPPELGAASFSRETMLASSAPDYLVISPPASGGVALGVSGLDGEPPESGAGLEILVVRLR